LLSSSFALTKFVPSRCILSNVKNKLGLSKESDKQIEEKPEKIESKEPPLPSSDPNYAKMFKTASEKAEKEYNMSPWQLTATLMSHPELGPQMKNPAFIQKVMSMQDAYVRGDHAKISELMQDPLIQKTVQVLQQMKNK